MWNQDWLSENDYDADEFGRFPTGAGFPGKQSADWGWAQHMLASLNDNGRRGRCPRHRRRQPGQRQRQQEQGKAGPRWFVENDLVEGVIYLPENLFYNTIRPGHPLVPEQGQAEGA